MHKTMVGDVEITSDGRTVWADWKGRDRPNGCAAWFGRFEYKVRCASASIEGLVGVVFDPSRQLTESDWRAFTAACERLLQVTIPESHKPAFAAVEG